MHPADASVPLRRLRPALPRSVTLSASRSGSPSLPSGGDLCHARRSRGRGLAAGFVTFCGRLRCVRTVATSPESCGGFVAPFHFLSPAVFITLRPSVSCCAGGGGARLAPGQHHHSICGLSPCAPCRPLCSRCETVRSRIPGGPETPPRFGMRQAVLGVLVVGVALGACNSFHQHGAARARARVCFTFSYRDVLCSCWSVLQLPPPTAAVTIPPSATSSPAEPRRAPRPRPAAACRSAGCPRQPAPLSTPVTCGAQLSAPSVATTPPCGGRADPWDRHRTCGPDSADSGAARLAGQCRTRAVTPRTELR